MDRTEYDFLIDAALKEDLGDSGDITSNAVFSTESGTAYLYSKDRGVLAGAMVYRDVFTRVDNDIDVMFKKNDGDLLGPWDLVAEVRGRVKSILTAERTAINFLSYLSGIASETARFTEVLRGHGKAVILDTRKTLPGYRSLAKYAVAAGGGQNHRMGLYDMVMIKDNHIDAAGGITAAVDRVRGKYDDRYRIEVECRTLEEVTEAAELKVDVIMLDNMDVETASRAVDRIGGRVLVEVSGNMDLSRLAEYGDIGVDYISVGKLTHSVRAFDFSLKWNKRGE